MQTEAVVAIPPTQPKPTEASKGTLLIVDDEPGPRESLRHAFKDLYQVVIATGGREAIEYATANSVDVVILDIMMPDLSGTEVLKKLKQHDPTIEVIILTGYETMATAREAVRHGASDYLKKPWDVAEVREIVARCMEKRQRTMPDRSVPPRPPVPARTVEREDDTRAGSPPVLIDRSARPPSAAAARPAQENITHWREYAQVLLERKWVSITTLVVVVTVTLLWNFRMTPIYRATTRVLVEGENVKVLNIQDVVSTDTRDGQYLNTQIKLLQSRTLAEQAVKSLGLDKSKEFLAEAGPDADFAAKLQRCLSMQLVRDSRLIDISAEHSDPQMAATLANGVASEFIKYNLERKISPSLEAVQWLRRQADEYKQKVEKSEIAIQEYREKMNAVSLEDHQNIVVDRLKELSSAVTKARTDRLAAEIEWNKVKALEDAGENLLSISAVAADSQVSALRQLLTAKQVAMSGLHERYEEKHPAMISAERELKELQDKLTKACAATAENIRANYLLAKAKEENLQQALKEQEQESLALSRNLIEYGVLKRNVEADRQLYDTILTRMKEAGITGQLDINNIRVVDHARVPSTPFKPRKARNLMLGVVMGLALGLGLSFAVHFYDDRIKTDEDVETYLGLPLLSSVPNIELPEPVARDLVTHLQPRSVAAEAFRNLRAAVNLSASGRNAQRLLVTSSAPGEGKSLVAANLATVFANDSQRTLLIDGDLRHPGHHKVFNITTERGLSDFLADSIELPEIVHKTNIPNLDVIAVGRVPANASELLGSARMRKLMEVVCQEYDRVIIDSPPVTAVCDPLVLLPQVDGVIVIVHFSKVRRDVVSRTVQKLRASGVPVVGAVLNNIDIQKHGYYYPYHYAYHYGHHHEKVTAGSPA